jgi:plastocyanin
MCRTTLIALAFSSILVAACDAPSQPDVRTDTRPTALRVRGAQGGADVRIITIKDACEPESFGAADVECLRNGGVLFDKFLSQLGKHQIMRAWHFAPSVVHAKVGQTLLAVNRGGEEHTFTEVEEFGGGIIPPLNELSGNLEVAPECLALADDDFIQPGGFDADDEVEEAGVEHYQCCIHPWMRATVIAK